MPPAFVARCADNMVSNIGADLPKSNIGAIVRQTQIGAKIVSTLALSGLLLSEPRPSADTRENQIGIDFDRFLSPSKQQAFVVVGQFLAAVNFRTLLDRNAPRPRPATLGAQMPPWAGCRAASKTEYESAKRDFLLQTSVGADATTGHWWRRYYWYCHL